MQKEAASVTNRIGGSHTVRIAIIFCLILILMIPLFVVSKIIAERGQTKLAAIADITHTWGDDQKIAGPVVSFPYVVERYVRLKDETMAKTRNTEFVELLPDRLRVDVSTVTKERYRGLFKVLIYEAQVTMEGSFDLDQVRETIEKREGIPHQDAYVTLSISDPHAIKEAAAITWGDSSLEMKPGVGVVSSFDTGIHTVLDDPTGTVDFKITLNMNGSSSIGFSPLGKTNTVSVHSNWPHPSFTGSWLPSQREISDAGFEAEWKIPALGRNFPQVWPYQHKFKKMMPKSYFGVDFYPAIDSHRMAVRAAKYGILFLIFTFISFWLFELFQRRRVHPIQYGLIGIGLCLFFLVQLALAEHIGYIEAYIVASLLIISLISLYTLSIFNLRAAVVIGGIIACLYAYLFVILLMASYSLLFGALGLLIVVAVIMYLTRKIDWYDPQAAG